MAKLVLEIKGAEQPNENDIIVYDKIHNAWKTVPKSLFLGKTNKEIENLKTTIGILRQEVNQAKEDIQTMAKIMKEGIK